MGYFKCTTLYTDADEDHSLCLLVPNAWEKQGDRVVLGFFLFLCSLFFHPEISRKQRHAFVRVTLCHMLPPTIYQQRFICIIALLDVKWRALQRTDDILLLLSCISRMQTVMHTHIVSLNKELARAFSVDKKETTL